MKRAYLSCLRISSPYRGSRLGRSCSKTTAGSRPMQGSFVQRQPAISTSVATNRFASINRSLIFGRRPETILVAPFSNRLFSIQNRHFSSRGNKKDKHFQLDALAFTVSPEEALEKFRKWAEQEQGLRYFLNYDSVRIGAAYVPVWSFDLNIRFKSTDPRTQRSTYSWKPSYFDAYKSSDSDVIYVPGLAAYAGYSYRRSLMHPVHSISLLFMGDETQPFGAWMLRDMKLQSTGKPVTIVPDAWNATQARAFQSIKDDLHLLVQGSEQQNVQVQTEVVRARRVYMPTFVIDYQIWGLEYRAFVSGCDQGAAVSGSNHQIYSGNLVDTDTQKQAFATVLNNTSALLRQPRFFPILFQILRPLLSVVSFFLLRVAAVVPFVGVVGGAFAGFRKVLQPWWQRRSEAAEWEQIRHEEGQEDELDPMNDFQETSGRPQQYFSQHKQRIRNALGGTQEHHEGDFDWYQDWQAWARQQWEQQQRREQQQGRTYQQQQQTYQQQQQRTTRTQAKSKPDYKWDFDPNDPYSVLGISRGATKKEVSDAFRREMLKHHPDTMPNASESQKNRAVERSKYISEAYRKIKSQMK